MGTIKDIVEKVKNGSISKQTLTVAFLCGALLLIIQIPSGGQEKKQQPDVKEEQIVRNENEAYVTYMEERITNALATVNGVGAVRVVLTLKTSRESIVNKDRPYDSEHSKETDQTRERNVTNLHQGEETVLIEGDIPYVIKEVEPQIEGVVVIAQGGDNPIVIQEITDTIQVLFSVPVHKIKVLKMQS